MNFYKITNEKEVHRGIHYKTGLNIDIQPFNPSGNGTKGGIYFAREDILAFLWHGPWIRKVILPEGEQVYNNPGKPKMCKAHRVILGERRRITAQVVKELIDEGADVNADRGEALNYAISLNKLDIVKVLVENGADINAGNGEPLFAAINCNKPDVVKMLVENSADANTDYEALFTAITYNKPDVVKMLVENGADVNVDNGELLQFAIQINELDIVKILVEHDANVNMRNYLYYARYKTEIAEYLMKKGARL